MTEEQLRELFKVTNTAEPLSEEWPGLLRYGLAVAAAEREECARACHLYAVDNRIHSLATRGAHDCEKAIRERSKIERMSIVETNNTEIKP